MSFVWKCEKHGELAGFQVVRWSTNTSNRWCRVCFEDMIAKFCCEAVCVEKEDNNQKGEK